MTIGAAALVTLLAAAPASATHPEFTSYAELQGLVADWARRGAEVQVAASSRQGRDIHRVRIGRGPVTLLMTNVLHANEPSGTEAFVRFAELLLGNPEPAVAGERLAGIGREGALFRHLADPQVRRELLSRVSVVGFPMMDPDGVEDGHRRDQLTNLDYSTRVTPQSAALGAAFREFEPDLLLDSHGGPPAPDLNIGYIKPDGVEPAIAAAGIRAGAVAWRAADALGVKLAYFEEWPLSLLAGQHGDPFTSVDQAYYDILIGVAPVTQEGYALEGMPVVYTETVGLQSTDPSISILEGASAQQVTMAGLALEASGLLTGERPGKLIADPRGGPLRIDLPPGARDLLAVVHWGRGVAEDPSGLAQDYALVVRDGAGGELGRAGGGEPSATRRSRAVALAEPARQVVIEATPTRTGLADGAVLRVTWRAPDAATPRLNGVLGDPARVSYCLREDSAWDTLAPRFRAPRCDAFAAERPPVAAPASSPRRCASRRRFTIRIGPPRLGRLRSTRVLVGGRPVPVRRRGGRLTAVVDLRGRPRGRVTVRIVTRTTRGRFTALRRYRTCAPRR